MGAVNSQKIIKKSQLSGFTTGRESEKANRGKILGKAMPNTLAVWVLIGTTEGNLKRGRLQSQTKLDFGSWST